MSAITRSLQTVSPVAITGALGTTEAITLVAMNAQTYAGGIIYIPAGSSLTSLTFYAAWADGEDFVAMVDHDGEAVSLTVEAGKCYPLPIATYGAALLKLVGNASGTIHLTLVG